jgi:hypothetical protein
VKPPLSRALVLHLLDGCVAPRAAVSGFVSGGVRDHGSRPLLRAGEDEVGDGPGAAGGRGGRWGVAPAALGSSARHHRSNGGSGSSSNRGDEAKASASSQRATTSM